VFVCAGSQNVYTCELSQNGDSHTTTDRPRSNRVFSVASVAHHGTGFGRLPFPVIH
jgi:hypothetical protein